MASEERKNPTKIKKISENTYVNVSKIKTKPVNLDISQNETETPTEKTKKDRNRGDETIGIP